MRWWTEADPWSFCLLRLKFKGSDSCGFFWRCHQGVGNTEVTLADKIQRSFVWHVGTSRPRLEYRRETGLILRCDRKVGNPFQTKWSRGWAGTDIVTEHATQGAEWGLSSWHAPFPLHSPLQRLGAHGQHSCRWRSSDPFCKYLKSTFQPRLLSVWQMGIIIREGYSVGSWKFLLHFEITGEICLYSYPKRSI